MSTPNKKKSVFIWWSTSLIFQVKMLEVSWNTSKKMLIMEMQLKHQFLSIYYLYSNCGEHYHRSIFLYFYYFFFFVLSLNIFFSMKISILISSRIANTSFQGYFTIVHVSSKSLWPKETELFFFLLIVAIHAFFDYYYYKI